MISAQILTINTEHEKRWQFARELHEILQHLDTLKERYPEEYKIVIGGVIKAKGDKLTPTLEFLSELEKTSLDHYLDNLPK